ncbi:MAG: hypothetical protein JXQ30_08115 [Spirochaetes bacterium]|nr:hypothetical protein [Spirochaetota bacterium]
MTLGIRILFFGLVGLFSGMLAWPCTELVLYLQAAFPTLLIFNAALGVTTGVLMGVCFGTSEGIIARSAKKIAPGAATGVGVGFAGGLVGFVAGQAALLHIGTVFFTTTTSFEQVGFPLSRAAGWAVFGMFIGSVEGIRSRSGPKVRNGVIGGLCGGIMGGLAVEYIRYLSPGGFFPRLVGFLVLGFMIGIFYGFIENRLARASLLLLNGEERNRTFLLAGKRTTVGVSEKTEVTLHGYGRVAPEHAVVTRVRGDYVLSGAGAETGAGSRSALYVNDERAESAHLKDGDVIRIGEAQFRFTKR